jgi:hypothetical protein
MSLTPETVIIQKATTVGDGAGGKTTTWVAAPGVPVGGWLATRNFYRKTSQQLIDEGTHAAEGPGVTVKTKCFFTFEGPPFPTLVRDKYRVVGGDAVTYRILHIRQYDDTLQVDCEAFD